MHAFHRRRLEAAMAAAGVDTLVASTPENLYYTTGHWSVASSILRSAAALAVCDTAGEVDALILACGDVGNFVAAGFDPERIYAYGRFYFEGGAEARAIQAVTALAEPGPAEALARALQALGRDRGRIGVDEGQVPLATWTSLPALLPGAAISPANAVFRSARLVKSTDEIALLERAAEIAEQALLNALRDARPGITERELARSYETEVAALGGSPFFTVVTFGERAALADTPPTDRALRSGDVMRFDLGAIYRGYRSDIARTAICGDADPRYAAYYEAMLAGVDAAIAAVRPGVLAEQLFDIAVDTVRRRGVPHYRRQHVGHAIGLEVYDALSLAPGSRTPLEADMVLCLETPYYEIGWGGVQVEDLVRVTPQGAVLLNKSTRHLLRVRGQEESQ